MRDLGLSKTEVLWCASSRRQHLVPTVSAGEGRGRGRRGREGKEGRKGGDPVCIFKFSLE